MIEKQQPKSFNGYLLRPVEKLFLSSNGLEFIKDWEGLEHKFYEDSAGYCTIGFGHLVHEKPCDGTHDLEKTYKQGISAQEAEKLLKSDVAKAERNVRKWIKGAVLTQSMFDALVSLTFNTGGNGGRWNVYRFTKDGKYNEAAKELDDIVYITDPATGQLVKIEGLVNRRTAEKNVYLYSQYEGPP